MNIKEIIKQHSDNLKLLQKKAAAFEIDSPEYDICIHGEGYSITTGDGFVRFNELSEPDQIEIHSNVTDATEVLEYILAANKLFLEVEA